MKRAGARTRELRLSHELRTLRQQLTAVETREAMTNYRLTVCLSTLHRVLLDERPLRADIVRVMVELIVGSASYSRCSDMDVALKSEGGRH